MNGLHDHDMLIAGQALRVPAYGRMAHRFPHPSQVYRPYYERGARERAAPVREVREAPPPRIADADPAPAPAPRRVADAAPSNPPVPIPRPVAPATDLHVAYAAHASLSPSEQAGPGVGARAPFIWPLDGVVISNFGTRQNGERNDGINIACTGGEEIRAAADGTVTYAGNELKSYGNLVLIKHANGFTSAYAHADRIMVHRGEHVTKGQIIAYAGATGDVREPQLHFELRRGTTPVDPRPLLQAYGL